MERRSSERQESSQEIRLRCEGNSMQRLLHGRLQNISPGGYCCLVEARISVGMQIELEISLPMYAASDAPVLIRATSHVIRSKPAFGETTFPFEIAAQIEQLHSSRAALAPVN
jgi:hypothetical protein